MYERSAVILERYFANKFYYTDNSNLKTNYENYCMLIEILEKYQEVSEAEDKIIGECEDIASKIKQIQKNQNSLHRRTIKLQEDRNALFENIGETAEELSSQLDRIEKEIDKSNERMRPLDKEFIEAIAKFNERSGIRAESGKKRRKVEKEYRALLEQTINNFNVIEPFKISEIKSFINADKTSLNEEIKATMLRNGESEKVGFDSGVIENSIIFGQNIHRKEASLLINVYQSTNSLINDINNNIVKINKHKKLVKDVKNQLEFINSQKEYLIQFLDNERLSVSLGKDEHKKLMKEACNDFKKDVEQINNLEEILLRETSGKATQKMYQELYKPEYLKDLQDRVKEFERKVKELNLVGKILNPIYWRVESIEKIYKTFDDIVVNEYERDLSKYKIEEVPQEDSPKEFIDLYSNLGKEEKVSNPFSDSIFNKEEYDEDDDDDSYYDNEFDIYDDEDDDSKDNTDEYEDEEYEQEEFKIYDEDENYDNDDEFEIYDDENNNEEDKEQENYEENDVKDIPLTYENIFQSDNKTENINFYEDDDDEDEEVDDSFYEDIDEILRNRKKRMRGRRSNTSKDKSFFGKLVGK